MEAIGYCRVSTQEQADSGAGLAAQRQAIVEAAALRGIELTALYEDPNLSGGTPWERRPGLTAAIRAIEAPGGPKVLICAKLDRLSRSVHDFVGLMERSRQKGWSIVLLDLGVDTTTPAGEMVANILASFAQFERRMISLRTKEALAQKKAQGIHCGRRSTVPVEVRERIRALREGGMSWCAIARLLNEEGVPTGQGGSQWRDKSVKYSAEAA